ncbi:MAG: hypothetical protein RIT27_483 [Pseudomonadota bacterium]|jgi:hypothetical protein
MKTLTSTILIFFSIISSTVAAMPIKIFFMSQDRSKDGNTFYVYQVECSDGRQPTISNWEDSKKWCLGTSNAQCEATRLKAASVACKLG